MNDRQRFYATQNFQPRDRVPVCDFNFWPETLEAWRSQGLPDFVTRHNSDAFFGMDSMPQETGWKNGLCPAFEWKVLEDDGHIMLYQNHEGVRMRNTKTHGSIPQHVSNLLVNRASWEEHYKWRLDPATPDREPANIEALTAHSQDPDRKEPLCLPCGGLYGWIRDWMGVEEVSYLIYDDPELFEEMVETVTLLTLGTLKRSLDAGIKVEAAAFWEDMCYNAGPLISPKHFRQFLQPRYSRITRFLKENGVDIVYLDSDGCIDALLPLWLEAGITCLFPLEVGTWKADPVKKRQQHGKQLRMMGGFGKKTLTGSLDEIHAEVERLKPLVDEGGYIPFADHRVPPDVPYTNYLYYLSCAREIWAEGINLKPMHPEAEKTFFIKKWGHEVKDHQHVPCNV